MGCAASSDASWRDSASNHQRDSAPTREALEAPLQAVFIADDGLFNLGPCDIAQLPRESDPSRSTATGAPTANHPPSASASTIDSDPDQDLDGRSPVDSHGSAEVILVPLPGRAPMTPTHHVGDADGAGGVRGASPLESSLVGPLSASAHQSPAEVALLHDAILPGLTEHDRSSVGQTPNLLTETRQDLEKPLPLPLATRQKRQRVRPESASNIAYRWKSKTSESLPRYGSPDLSARRSYVARDAISLASCQHEGSSSSSLSRNERTGNGISDTMARFLRFRSKTPPV